MRSFKTTTQSSKFLPYITYYVLMFKKMINVSDNSQNEGDSVLAHSQVKAQLYSATHIK